MNAMSLPSTETSGSQLPSTMTSTGVRTAWMLAKREWVRFFRQPFRIIAALGQPILFWILFGTGLHGAFRGPDANESFMAYFLPGTTAMILLFTAIFSTITIIEDRREGFLQGVLVAPPGRWSIVVGKTLGGAAIAWAQSMLFLALAWLSGSFALGWSSLLLAAFLFLSALSLTALGVLCAWPMDSTQGYHAFMNLVLIPMWLMSGAFFPIPSLEADQPIGQIILHWVMKLNPMTYVVGGLRHYLAPILPPTTSAPPDPSFWTAGLVECWWITGLFAAIAITLAMWMVQKRQKGELQ